jgi:predicted Zn-dependent protease with MMP-like domain
MFIVTPELFRKHVARAVDEIPQEFQEKMENVEILVEDFPDSETIESLDLDSEWDLLGLYVGVPLTERSMFAANIMPERIYLYRRPILRAALGKNVTQLVREVIIHEVGHHFGFDDEQLDEMIGRSQ